ncbi:MAG: SDR family NAD(P)-dependent oxidoreductase [Planctomycetota bacterium]
MQLTDAKIFITGGSAGIGLSIAELALQKGAQVVINGRDEARLQSAGSQLGVTTAAGDVGVPAAAASMVETAASAMGGLNVLINNAGWGVRMPLDELDPEQFEAMWRTNVLGASLVAHHCVPHLKAAGGGSIVNMASTAARRGYANGSGYCSTKFALTALTQCWQGELRPHDIRVMQINPSEVQTGFGGRDPNRDMDPKKLIGADIAHATIAALEMADRGFIPELTVFATNPWPAE